MGVGVLTEASEQNSMGLEFLLPGLKRIEPGSGETVAMEGENRRGQLGSQGRDPKSGQKAGTQVGGSYLAYGLLGRVGPAWAGRGEAGDEPGGAMRNSGSFRLPAAHLHAAWDGERGRRLEVREKGVHISLLHWERLAGL